MEFVRAGLKAGVAAESGNPCRGSVSGLRNDGAGD